MLRCSPPRPLRLWSDVSVRAGVRTCRAEITCGPRTPAPRHACACASPVAGRWMLGSETPPVDCRALPRCQTHRMGGESEFRLPRHTSSVSTPAARQHTPLAVRSPQAACWAAAGLRPHRKSAGPPPSTGRTWPAGADCDVRSKPPPPPPPLLPPPPPIESANRTDPAWARARQCVCVCVCACVRACVCVRASERACVRDRARDAGPQPTRGVRAAGRMPAVCGGGKLPPPCCRIRPRPAFNRLPPRTGGT